MNSCALYLGLAYYRHRRNRMIQKLARRLRGKNRLATNKTCQIPMNRKVHKQGIPFL